MNPSGDEILNRTAPSPIGPEGVDFERNIGQVLNTGIDAISWPQALDRISTWASRRESRYVCICNVHSVVTATQDRSFEQVINQADLATPDGAPVAWMLRGLGFKGQRRINGPDLMLKYCEMASARNDSVFLFGNTEETLEILRTRLRERFPSLRIAGAISPPFRPMNEQEDAEVIATINASGAGTVWVSLGCPKQEKWMAAHRDRIHAVMVGVGAAFDYHAGTLKRAPSWMQNHGLEWLHRMVSEPRRLTKRYLQTNSIFIVKALRQLIRGRANPGKS
jgi:N-acetylglucosaminyldiphosphoundecaprenol N-acetyl-beta-D-mannosaminyltransferase